MSDYTHKYIGPSTKWGLNKNAKVKIVGKGGAAGGKLIRAEGVRRTFVVNKNQLEPVNSKR